MGKVEEAFAKLYNDTYNSVLKYVLVKCSNADDAPDIVQKVYLNFFERLKKDGDIENPEGYLFRIAQNEIKKYYHLKTIHKNDIPVFSKSDDDNFEFEELEAFLLVDNPRYNDLDIQEVWQFIRRKDAITFKIFVLYFYYNEKLSSIAEMLNIGESAVKNKLYRTIRQMQEYFRL